MFACDRLELLRAAELASKSTKSALKEMNRISLISTEDGRLVVRATNGSTAVEVTTENCRTEDADEEINVLVEPSRLTDILKSTSDDKIEVFQRDQDIGGTMNTWAAVKTGRSKVELPSENPAVFPPSPTSAKRFTVDGGRLRELIGFVSKFQSRDQSNEGSVNITGVSLDSDAGHLVAVGFQGRSAVVVARIEAPDADIKAILPPDFVDLILASKIEGPAVVDVLPSKVGIAAGGLRIAGVLLEGKVAPYKAFSSIGTQIAEFAFTPAEFSESLAAARVVREVDQSGVDVDFDGSSLNFSVSTNRGSAESSLAVEDATGNFSGRIDGDFVSRVLKCHGVGRFVATEREGSFIAYRFTGATADLSWVACGMAMEKGT